MDNRCYTKYKKYEELKFTDGFIFYKIMTANKNLCQAVIERILGVRIKEIRYVQGEKVIETTYRGKGVRLDVYVDDEEGTIYNLEMQAVDTGELPQRSRFYQSAIDQELLDHGEPYTKLGKSYVIFLCTFDLFGKGLGKYTFQNRADEDPEIFLGDNAIKIFLNSKGKSEYRLLQNLLNYMNGLPAEGDDPLIGMLDSACEQASHNQEWRAEYMRTVMHDELIKTQARAEGKAEGKVEGIEIGKRETLLSLVKDGIISVAQAAAKLSTTEEEVQKAL